jgi:MSHA biogenesis protein MshG
MEFTYTGKNSNGEIITGKLEATNIDEAKEALNNQKITIIELDLDNAMPKFIDQLNFFNHPSSTDLIIFSKQMHSLLKSGVPIIKSINVVSDSCKNEKLAKTLTNVANRLESGYGFADSIAKHPKIFPKIMWALINLGEQTGTLDKCFKEISVHLEKEDETKKRIKAAIRYPIFVVFAIFVALIIMNIVVIPAFTGFFAQFHAKLPLPTRILINTSKFTVSYWKLILGIFILSIVLIINYLKTQQGRYLWDRFKVNIPIVGSIIKRSLLSRFARSFALCFRTGMPLLESISIIGTTCDNIYMENRLLNMKNSIEHGESMTIAAKNSKLFNSLVLQMILIGEESGELDRLLDEVSYFYEQELDYDIKQLSSLIEPILISIMAGMVLILALGIFLPMWELSRVTSRY